MALVTCNHGGALTVEPEFDGVCVSRPFKEISRNMISPRYGFQRSDDLWPCHAPEMAAARADSARLREFLPGLSNGAMRKCDNHMAEVPLGERLECDDLPPPVLALL